MSNLHDELDNILIKAIEEKIQGLRINKAENTYSWSFGKNITESCGEGFPTPLEALLNFTSYQLEVASLFRKYNKRQPEDLIKWDEIE